MLFEHFFWWQFITDPIHASKGTTPGYGIYAGLIGSLVALTGLVLSRVNMQTSAKRLEKSM